MPNVVKYNTSTESLSLRKGNFYLGVSDVGKGPTSSTGFYNGINPPSGGYTIYLNKVSGGPSIYTASNDAGLISLTNQIAGTSYTGVQQCFVYFAGQSDKIVVNENYPSLITNGLVFMTDASFLPSYPTSGTSWYDMGPSGSTGILYNGPTFDTAYGSITFDGTNDYYQINQRTTNTEFQWNSAFTINVLVYTPTNTGDQYIICNRFTDANNFAYAGWAIVQVSNVIHSIIGGFPGGASSWMRATTSSTPFTNLIYNKWSYITYRNTGVSGEQKIFINGVDYTNSAGQDTTPPMTITYSNGNSRVTLGRDGAYSNYFNGKISKSQIYNRALSQDEILQNYYQGPIVTGNLIWYLDASNLASYQSGSTTTYTLTGSVNASLNNGTGFDTANQGVWSFDGSDDLISTTTNVNNATTDISVELWFNASTLPNGFKTLFFNGNPAANGYGLILRDSSLAVFFSQYGDIMTKTGISTNTWYHVVFTRTTTPSTSNLLYVNGVQDKSNTTNFYFTPNVNPSGIWQYLGAAVNGKIGLVRFYTKALSAAEVSQNFNAQRDRFGI